MLYNEFFDRDSAVVAKNLLGKVIRVNYQNCWLSAAIIETEAYYLNDKGSHASLGYTEKRKALFMPPGTIYMYYSRGGDSLNISCRGKGNAVLIKSGIPFTHSKPMLSIMQQLNPKRDGVSERNVKRLCSGQTLLCKSLGLLVKEWDQKKFDKNKFFIDDVNCTPRAIIQTRRLGIPKGRDEHLPYRFIDYDYAPFCTENPLRKRGWQEGKDYVSIQRGAKPHENAQK